MAAPSLESAKKSNRDRYPEIANFVDNMRKIFGENVIVVSLEELKKPPRKGG